MSMAGMHKGMDDERFLPFLDMIRILICLQANQLPTPLYLFENTYPGTPGQYPLVDDAAKMVESFLGAPIIVDAAALGSAAHRVGLFWTNWCRPELLQIAIPANLPPSPSDFAQGSCNLDSTTCSHLPFRKAQQNRDTTEVHANHSQLSKEPCLQTQRKWTASRGATMEQEDEKMG